MRGASPLHLGQQWFIASLLMLAGSSHAFIRVRQQPYKIRLDMHAVRQVFVEWTHLLLTQTSVLACRH